MNNLYQYDFLKVRLNQVKNILPHHPYVKNCLAILPWEQKVQFLLLTSAEPLSPLNMYPYLSNVQCGHILDGI
jgi:hypothetical protein